MKSIIKVSLKALGFVALMVSTSVYATNIEVGGSTIIVDDRESAGDANASGQDEFFNIDQMSVSWSSDETITVDIFTNFATTFTQYGGVTANNYFTEGSTGEKIVYGDLLINLTDTAGNNSNYAFFLGEDRWKTTPKSPMSTGGLFETNGFYTSGWYHGTNKTGKIAGMTVGPELGTNTSWGVSQSTNQWGHSQGKISFSFNVAGLSMFQNATSLGLSWAMSCFNDDVGGTYAVNRTNTAVPEPGTMVLMLLALAGLVYRQKKISNNFSA